jgi:hypothetical protein
MAKIITYRNEGSKGVFCQLKLESGERILISMTQNNTKIFKLGLMGLVPMGTIWESSDIEEMIRIFADPANPEKHPLDAIIGKLIDCKSIDELKLIIVKEKSIEQESEKPWEQFKRQSNIDKIPPDVLEAKINEIYRKKIIDVTYWIHLSKEGKVKFIEETAKSANKNKHSIYSSLFASYPSEFFIERIDALITFASKNKNKLSILEEGGIPVMLICVALFEEIKSLDSSNKEIRLRELREKLLNEEKFAPIPFCKCLDEVVTILH